jgi:hypothetical protein
MKKLFSILALICFSIGLNAQIVSTMALSTALMTNSTAVTATLQTKSVCGNISIQAVATKSTGTVAGTVQVSASLDGINYIALTSSTLALTDIATNSAIFTYSVNNYLFWKVTFTGTGTMVATPSASLFTSGATQAHATQNLVSPTLSVSATTTNTATSYVTLPVQLWYDNITIQSVVTKVSGTVTGTVTLQGSLDGVVYNTVSSSYADVTSYSPTDVATSTKMFIINGSPYRYYRLSYAGTGTMNASHRGYLLPNKR